MPPLRTDALPTPDPLEPVPVASGPVAPDPSTLLIGGGRDDRPASNLPAPPTALVGREREVEALRYTLLRADVRLLTLTGPGGVGKTRLALAAAIERVEDFADGVWFVPLAPVRDPERVAAAVAQALATREETDRPVAATLADALRDRHLLLVLDNFEQVAPAAPLVADLLAACPKLKILATSRERLHLRAEHEFPVAPLPLPAPGDPAPALTSPAVALFVERARAADPAFALTELNAPAVAEICRRLDGLPLAIELAAARVRLLPPRALLARLDDHLGLLAGGPRDLPARQQTLRAAIAWSYDLLTRDEQRLFRLLTVFAGGRAVEAVEAVTEGVRHEARGMSEVGLPPHASSLIPHAFVLDGLASLVDKNLLRRLDAPDDAAGPRFWMLSTIHAFGRELLDASGEADAARRAHAAHFLALAESAEPGLIGPDQAAWLDRLEADHDNLRAALAWATAPRTKGSGPSAEQNAPELGPRPSALGPAVLGLRLAAALWRFWATRGFLSEGRGWLERALVETVGAPPADRAKALHHLANVLYDLGDYAQARSRYEAALALRRELGDKRGVAESLNGLGLLAAYAGDYARARALHEEALALRRELGDRRGTALSLNNLGDVAADEGDHVRARALHEEALALYRAVGDEGNVAYALANLGRVAALGGDDPVARALLDDALARFRASGDKAGIAFALHTIGLLAHRHGDVHGAAVAAAEALTLRQQVGDKRGIAEVLEALAAVAWDAGLDPAAGVRLAAAAEALRETIGAPLPPADAAAHRRRLAAARGRLGQAFAAGWAEGRSLTLDQAIAAANDVATTIEAAPTAPASPDAPTYPAGLSAREVEVLRLLAAGLTNAQIADRLFISPRTVNAHLHRIYPKLDVPSRAAAIRFALDHGLTED